MWTGNWDNVTGESSSSMLEHKVKQGQAETLINNLMKTHNRNKIKAGTNVEFETCCMSTNKDLHMFSPFLVFWILLPCNLEFN